MKLKTFKHPMSNATIIIASEKGLQNLMWNFQQK